MRFQLILILSLMVLPLRGQSYEIYEGDTINVIKNKLKQGLWVKFDNAKESVIEKGHYKNSKKSGVWFNYYPSGQKKNEISYTKGKAIGPASFYYPDGKVSEQGYWNIDHWEGEYKFYHESGQLAYDWNYDKSGRRTGTQKYYHENGELKYEGDWVKGKTTGSLKMFNESGQLITERIYDDQGKFASNVKHTPTPKNVDAEEHDVFKGTGMHTVYTLQGKPERKGFFVRGKLFNGQCYQYKSNGELEEIEHYENGQLKRTEKVKNPG